MGEIPKADLNTLLRPRALLTVIIMLLTLCVIFYAQKEKERSVRITKETELIRTVEAKRLIEDDLTEAKKQIAAKDEQIRITLDKLQKEITGREEVEAHLTEVTKERQALEAKVQKLTAASPKNIELEKIVIKNTRELKGNVLTYDKENSLVVVNLGSENNLKSGDILSVYRNDKFTGKVQVEKVEEKSSVAAILSPWKNVEFKENDVVRKL